MKKRLSARVIGIVSVLLVVSVLFTLVPPHGTSAATAPAQAAAASSQPTPQGSRWQSLSQTGAQAWHKLGRTVASAGHSLSQLIAMLPGESMWGSSGNITSSTSTPTPAPNLPTGPSVSTATTNVTPTADATLTSPDGKVSLLIPAGAASENLRVDYKQYTPPDSAGMRFLKTFAFTAYAVDRADTVVTQFQKNLTITLKHDDAELRGIDLASLHLYYLNESTHQWIPQTSSYDPKTKTLTVTTNHFTNEGEIGATLQSGPGRIMAFDTNLHSGTASASYSINVPDGPGGFKPNIQLTYDSGVVDGMKDKRATGSWVGMGWTLNMGRITTDLTTSKYYLDLNGSNCELIYSTPDNCYYSQPDQYLKVTKTANVWDMWDKSGIHYQFGGTSDSQQYSSGTYYRWDLNLMEDTHGNQVTVTYTQDYLYKDGYTTVRSAYPLDVTYNGGHVDIHFNSSFDITGDPTDGNLRNDNPKSIYDNKAPRIMENKKLDSIEVKVDSALVRKYAFTHATTSSFTSNDYGGIYYSGTFTLSSITEIGADGSSQLPSMTFSYSNLEVFYQATPGSQPTYSGNPGNPASISWPHLQTVNSGYGGTVTYAYTEMPASGTYDIWTREVVTQKTVSSGLSGAVNQTYTYSYSANPEYRGAKWSEEFRGFRQVTQTDAAGNYTVHKFYTTGVFPDTKSGEILTGREYSVETHASGGALLQQTQSYWDWHYNSRGYPAQWSVGTDSTLGSAVDSNGNVYVAVIGQYWQGIREYDRTGAQIGSINLTGFEAPRDVAVDSTGYVYVVGGAGQVWKFWYGMLDRTFGQFVNATGVAVDQANNWVYVVDSYYSRVQKFTTGGTWLADWTSADYGFGGPKGIDVDVNGNVYVADTGNNRVLRLSSSGTVLGTWGSYGTGDGQFNGPWAVATDAGGHIYVADRYNNRVQVFSNSDYSLVAKITGLSSQSGIGVDPANSRIYVSYGSSPCLKSFQTTYAVTLTKTEETIGAKTARTRYVYDSYGNVVTSYHDGDTSTASDDATTYQAFYPPLTLRPNGIGAYANIVSQNPPGVDHWTLVDEATPDETSTQVYQYYISSGWKYDAYALENHTSESAPVRSVTVYFRTGYNGWAQPGLRLGTNETLGTAVSLSMGGFVTYSQTLARPSGGSWTWSDIDDLQVIIGLKCADDYGSYAASLTQIYVVVDYYSPLVMDRPGLVRLYSGIKASDDGGTGLKTETRYFYDGHTNYTDQPSVGDPTKVESYDPGSATTINTQKAYDTYGNVTSETDAKGKTTSYTYDTTYHTFVLTRTLPSVGGNPTMSESYAWSYTGARMTSETDVNGQTTSYEYDTFWRPVKLIRPGDSPASPTIQHQYTSWGTINQQHIYTTQKIDGSTSLWTKRYFDGLGRVAQVQAKGETGRTIVATTAYNNRGLVDKEYVSQDLDSATLNGYKAPEASWKYASPTYDALARVTSRTAVDGTTVSNAYSDWQATVTNERGKKKRYYYDAFSRLTKVEELDDSFAVYSTTTYQYDVLGNLTQVVDNASNTTTMTYNGFSRKTAMTDPDMGSWSYVYDNKGNLTSQTDAKSQTITFEYDELGRLTAKKQGGAAFATFTYDSTAGGNYGKGRRTGMSDGSGTMAYKYDTRGRLIQETRTVDSTDYTTGYTYDSADRQATVTYPGGEVATQTYNGRGLPSSLSSSASGTIVSSALYNGLGLATELNLGNNTRTTYGYWDTGGTYDTSGGYYGRLWEIKTVKDPSGTPVTHQDVRHTWDAGGNLAQRQDVVASETESFGYDFLDRLTSVSGPYSESYSYNQIGNMTAKNGASYTYGSQPHAVTAVGSTSYVYDANGNMTTRGAQTIAWDVENRPTSVTQGGWTAAAFTYDGNGNRVKKTGNGETHTYVNQYYEKTQYAGPRALWHFDEGSGTTTADSSGNGNNGTLQGPAWTTGKSGNALQYDGSDDRVDYGNPSNLNWTGNLTIEAWFNIDSILSTYQAIVFKWNYDSPDMFLDITSSGYGGQLRAGVNGTINYGSSAVPTGRWVHAALTVDGTNWNFYLDGVLDVSRPSTVTYVGGTKTVYTGYSPYPGYPEWFNGKIDEVSIYDRALSAAEVALRYRQGLTGAVNVDTLYYYLGGKLVALKQGGTLSYVAQDHLTGTSLTTDASGNKVDEMKYLPYGGTRSGDITSTDKKFTGQRLDNTGLYYYNARYYDPAIGRFVSPDTLIPDFENPQALDKYSYVLNNPLKYGDPTGQFPWLAALAVVNVIINWGSITYDAYQLYRDPSLQNLGWLALDLVDPSPAPHGVIHQIAKQAGKEVAQEAGEQAGRQAAKKTVIRHGKVLGNSTHHIVSPSNGKYKEAFESIVSKYGLDLNAEWNKIEIPQDGRHPDVYHDWVLQNLERISAEAGEDADRFNDLFNTEIRDVLLKEPERIFKEFY